MRLCIGGPFVLDTTVSAELNGIMDSLSNRFVGQGARLLLSAELSDLRLVVSP